MPHFDFSLWHQAVPCYVGFHTLAKMLYPDNAKKQKEIFAAMVADKYFTGDTWPLQEGAPVATVWALLKQRHQDRSTHDIFADGKKAWMKGSIAGQLLMDLRVMEAYVKRGLIPFASVKKAIHLLLKKGRDGVSTTGGMPIDYRNFHSLQDNAWTPYRCVAHLWAANNVMVSHQCLSPTPSQRFVVHSWYEEADGLCEFLALAENFRQFGENYTPHGQKTPTLPPTDTWSVPEYYHVHLPSPLVVPEPTRKFLEALSDYRARR